MSRSLAAHATTLSATVAGDYLATHGYQSGYSRVWRAGGEFVSALGFRFFAPRDADGLQRLALRELSTSRAFAGFEDPAVPGAAGYTLTSDVAGATKFCAGEWFTANRDAFVVTRCATHPLDTAAAATLAQQEYRYQLRRRG
jgi:hypothetical protein